MQDTVSMRPWKASNGCSHGAKEKLSILRSKFFTVPRNGADKKCIVTPKHAKTALNFSDTRV